MERLKVVVRYSNGKVIKGFTEDFFPHKERFHFIPADNPSGGAIEVLPGSHLHMSSNIAQFLG